MSDRSEFLQQLQQGRHGKMLELVVQPHVIEAMYRRIEADGTGNVNSYRLMLVETVLNASRVAVTGLGADLYVITGLT